MSLQSSPALAISFFVLALIALPSLALAEEGKEDVDHAEHHHQLIRILERRVVPEKAELHKSDAIGWVNYSSQRARISFDQDVAKHMTCRSKGAFRLDGERLSSAPIQATQFASLCSLAPGSYEYRVELMSGVGGSGGGTSRTVTGTLTVQP